MGSATSTPRRTSLATSPQASAAARRPSSIFINVAAVCACPSRRITSGVAAGPEGGRQGGPGSSGGRRRAGVPRRPGPRPSSRAPRPGGRSPPRAARGPQGRAGLRGSPATSGAGRPTLPPRWRHDGERAHLPAHLCRRLLRDALECQRQGDRAAPDPSLSMRGATERSRQSRSPPPALRSLCETVRECLLFVLQIHG